MKYSKYFGVITREKGQPNFVIEQFQRMMNIIATENKIEGLRIARELNKNKELYHQFDLVIFRYDRVLTELTGNQKPENLIKEMYHFSNN